ncbi:MAG: FliI/YscN family ATPase [Oscillospiraceae bacterium]|jgi:flagellum-specific ATP synthase|nr:FliI/YscN family ATPase [Oscillospiraceae bacterium]
MNERIDGLDYQAFIDELEDFDPIRSLGKIVKLIGLTIESRGPQCSVGDVCKIISRSKNSDREPITAEVIGFVNGNVLLMPYTDTEGIGPGDLVENTGTKLEVRTGKSLRGRIIDALGFPLDEGELPYYTGTMPIAGIPVNPLTRPKIAVPIELGVKAIDGLTTLGKGQRIGIFAGSGVGKSTLMGMIAKKVKADINVIALVGERGREVREFIENDLGEEGMARSVVVVATSDQPAMMRSKCPLTATSIAEYYMRQGLDVLLMMDNLTRYAMALREVGLSAGEPPIARGFTPSIYSALPKLLERSGNFTVTEPGSGRPIHGSITGIYAVLVEGDDTNEPISDTVRGIIDGHIILSRKIAAKNHYPAIDILGSVSRLMTLICEKGHLDAAAKLRNLLALYEQNIDLISIGAYKRGTNPALDEAIAKIDKINGFLQQGVKESFDLKDTIKMLMQAVADAPKPVQKPIEDEDEV